MIIKNCVKRVGLLCSNTIGLEMDKLFKNKFNLYREQAALSMFRLRAALIDFKTMQQRHGTLSQSMN